MYWLSRRSTSLSRSIAVVLEQLAHASAEARLDLVHVRGRHALDLGRHLGRGAVVEDRLLDHAPVLLALELAQRALDRVLQIDRPRLGTRHLGLLAADALLALVLTRERHMLRVAAVLLPVVGHPALDDRAHPAPELALGAAVEGGLQRALDHGPGDLFHAFVRNPQRDAAADRALVSEGQAGDRAAHLGGRGGGPRLSHVLDELIIVALV
jgi:hypothetical protein